MLASLLLVERVCNLRKRERESSSSSKGCTGQGDEALGLDGALGVLLLCALGLPLFLALFPVIVDDDGCKQVVVRLQPTTLYVS